MLDEEGGLVFHLGSNPGGYRDVYIGFSSRRRKQRRPSLGHHTETWCGKWILGTPLDERELVGNGVTVLGGQTVRTSCL